MHSNSNTPVTRVLNNFRLTGAYLCNVLLGLLLGSTPLHAQPPENCTCIWQGSFVEAAPDTDLVITGHISASKGNSIDVQNLKPLLDPHHFIREYITSIRVWGNNGQLCRPDISSFRIGTDWVLALTRINNVPEGGFNPSTPNISFGREGDFFLSQCGAYWLSLKDNFVSGNIIDGPRWSWKNDKDNPVLLELLLAYLHGTLPREALKEASKPPSELRQLMQDTQLFLRQQD